MLIVNILFYYKIILFIVLSTIFYEMHLSIIDFYALIVRGRRFNSQDRHLLEKYEVTQQQADEMASNLSVMFFFIFNMRLNFLLFIFLKS